MATLPRGLTQSPAFLTAWSNTTRRSGSLKKAKLKPKSKGPIEGIPLKDQLGARLYYNTDDPNTDPTVWYVGHYFPEPASIAKITNRPAWRWGPEHSRKEFNSYGDAKEYIQNHTAELIGRNQGLLTASSHVHQTLLRHHHAQQAAEVGFDWRPNEVMPEDYHMARRDRVRNRTAAASRLQSLHNNIANRFQQHGYSHDPNMIRGLAENIDKLGLTGASVDEHLDQVFRRIPIKRQPDRPFQGIFSELDPKIPPARTLIANPLKNKPRNPFEAQTQPMAHESDHPDNPFSSAHFGGENGPVKESRRDRLRKAATLYSSPNEGHLNIDQALAAIESPSHGAYRERATQLLAGLGGSADALGAWRDGAENSLVHVLDKDPGELGTRQLAAKLGLLGRQKAILSYREVPDGPDLLHSFTLPVDPKTAHRALLDRGVEFHTLQPTSAGTRVHVVDQGGRMGRLLAAFSRSHNAPIRSTAGVAEFVGDPEGSSREVAAQVYRRILGPTTRSSGTHPQPIPREGVAPARVSASLQ